MSELVLTKAVSQLFDLQLYTPGMHSRCDIHFQFHFSN